MHRRHLCAGLVSFAVTPAAAAAPSGLDGVLRRYGGQGVRAGALIVARPRQILVRRGFGLADPAKAAKVDAATPFRIGSITKQFTAACILKLAEAGKLGLHDPLIERLKGAPAGWRGITLWHLLTHTSGLPDYTRLKGVDLASLKDLSVSDLIRLIKDRPVEFAPGSQFVYDNTGYVLLGQVVADVSGRPFGAFMREALLTPAGLRRTGFVTDSEPTDRAIGMTRQGPAPWRSNVLHSGAGGLYSTADDLLAWDRALHGGKVIGARSAAMMVTDNGHQYGLGIGVQALDGHPEWEHNGHVAGYSSWLARYPADDLTVVLLTSADFGPVEPMARDIARPYLREPSAAASSASRSAAPAVTARARPGAPLSTWLA
jgi:CubicO group peptidase (beta-lactamase class C family)